MNTAPTQIHNSAGVPIATSCSGQSQKGKG